MGDDGAVLLLENPLVDRLIRRHRAFLALLVLGLVKPEDWPEFAGEYPVSLPEPSNN